MAYKKQELIHSILEDLDASLAFEYYFGEQYIKVYESFVSVMSSQAPALKNVLGYNRYLFPKILNTLFDSTEYLNYRDLSKYLLHTRGFRYCAKCDTVYSESCFRPNSTRLDGLNSYCKYCQLAGTKITQAARQAKYKSVQLNSIPSWANMECIAKIYSSCPEGYHVDHIIPLQGAEVCGLHVENNLQYLPASENISKGNKLIAEYVSGRLAGS